jgi:prepilin-type N-terminal cleavage/methylation domain-containing protein
MNRQAGMTMVELITALAITGIIVAFLGTAIYQIMTVSQRGNNEFTAMHELQNAAFWFTKDGQEAKAAVGGSQVVLTLADNSTVTYALTGTSLKRTVGSLQTVLARNIASAAFTVNARLVTMSLTSTPAGQTAVSESQTYTVYLRPVTP